MNQDPSRLSGNRRISTALATLLASTALYACSTESEGSFSRSAEIAYEQERAEDYSDYVFDDRRNVTLSEHVAQGTSELYDALSSDFFDSEIDVQQGITEDFRTDLSKSSLYISTDVGSTTYDILSYGTQVPEGPRSFQDDETGSNDVTFIPESLHIRATSTDEDIDPKDKLLFELRLKNNGGIYNVSLTERELKNTKGPNTGVPPEFQDTKPGSVDTHTTDYYYVSVSQNARNVVNETWDIIPGASYAARVDANSAQVLDDRVLAKLKEVISKLKYAETEGTAITPTTVHYSDEQQIEAERNEADEREQVTPTTQTTVPPNSDQSVIQELPLNWNSQTLNDNGSITVTTQNNTRVMPSPQPHPDAYSED